MHEVSFQDKEKEHLTRLQDAEEMKVCARPLPQSPACIWTAFSYSRKICLLQRLVWPCRREGRDWCRPWHTAAWRRTERKAEVSRSPVVLLR